MYLDSLYQLKFSIRIFLISLAMAIIIFYLNEIISYQKNLSSIINVLVLVALITLFILSKFYGMMSILFVSILFNTRPRELHLIDLADRGNFNYFSINIQKLGPFVISTDIMIIFIIISTLTIVYQKRLSLKPLQVLFIYIGIGFCGALILTMIDGDINFNKVIQDLRFVILFIGGFVIAQVINFKLTTKNIIEKFTNFLLFIFLINILLSIINFLYDYSEGYFKLQYSVNTLMILFIFFFLLTLKNNNIYNWIFFIACFFVLIPFTRGEQLNYIILFILSILFVFKQNNLKLHIKMILYYVVIIFIMLNIIVFIQYNFESTYNYFITKASFFINGTSTDHSSSMRINELNSILEINTIYDYFRLLFGSGFGGYYSFNSNIYNNLDLADYSQLEITNNKFYQPHMFITYFFLKTGIVGTMLIIYLFFSKIQLKLDVSVYKEEALFNRLYILIVFSLIYNSYWMPQTAFIAGFMYYILSNINKNSLVKRV